MMDSMNMNELKVSSVEWARLDCRFYNRCQRLDEKNCTECRAYQDNAPKVDRGVPC